ncbi:hypothetical protein BOTBODRAFT_165022 [Botryobasidium botryosum FD-172 SS1]|uniref:Enoyl reductase (ER) domain-containing protein n=1 Tax=Botryobasidium botryosum (strain FD-172 SS1) TaxID=930990 RepID=A0A067M0S8_BOTB1|nr:hypothetical protein BOTBODRAFT_165022 [Botryobasidium botryosum FD-172 SS1]
MQAAANFAQGRMDTTPTVIRPEYQGRADGSTMKALAWFGARDVRLVEVPIPAITEPDDVIVKVTGTTICGSDLHLYNSEILTLQKGDILGHEFMGIIDEVGPNVKNLKPGQRVVASFQIACGKCEYCKKNWSSLCDRTNSSSFQNAMYGHRDAGLFGYSHMAGGFPGGQAEYVRVPLGEVNLLPLPDNVADERALWLSDVLPTSYHAVADTVIDKGDVVGVWGLGPIGQCVVRWALLKGASRVIVVDRIPERLRLAAEVPGVETIDFSEHTDVVKRIQELVPGGLDVAIDAGTFHQPKTLLHKIQKALMLETDVPEIINETIMAVKKGGRIGIIAAYGGFMNNFNIGAVMEKGIRLIGNGQAPVHRYWKELLQEYIIPGKFDPKFMVTHRVSLDEFVELYEAFDRREGGVNKVFVETKFSAPPTPGFPELSRVEDWSNIDTEAELGF